MSRPWYLNLAPLNWRTFLYYRFCRKSVFSHPGWFQSAPLAMASGTKMRLHCGDEMHGCIAATGIYEFALSKRILNLARTGGLLVDVGANYGYFSILWASARTSNTVIAFEASPRNLPNLRHNVASNELTTQVTIEPMAAGLEDGTLHFDLGPEHQTGWGGASTGEGIDIPCVSLDSKLANCSTIDVLKIDVEGADTWVIYGAKRLIESRKVKHIFFELNKPRMRLLGIHEKDSLNFLNDHGYSSQAIDNPDAEIVEYHAFPRNLP